MLEEYFRVLAYPKFRLGEDEIRTLMDEEVLPFIKPVRVRIHLRAVLRDPDDDKFLECAVCGKARYLVTGDEDLKALGSHGKVKIVSVGEFLGETGL